MDFLGTCILRTTCYVVTFRFKPIRDQGYISAACTLEIFQEHAENLEFTFPAYFSLMDLPRLIAYFEDHIAGLKTNPYGIEGLNAVINNQLSYTHAHVFLDQEFNFEMQALLGEVDPNDEGAFSLRFMFKTSSGLSTQGHIDWVHIGAQGNVSVAQIREFNASIRELAVKNREHFLRSLTDGQLRLQKVVDFYGGKSI